MYFKCSECDEFVEDTPESYDDVMTSGLNSEIKKGVLLFISLIYIYIYNPLKSRSLQIITALMGFLVYI